MRRRRRRESEGGGAGWLTTYSDMATLLLTFFILLFTYSNVDAQKFRALSSSLQFSLNGSAGGGSILEGNPPANSIKAVVPGSKGSSGEAEGYTPEPSGGKTMRSREIQGIYRTVHGFVEKEGLSADVKLRTDRRGVIIDINESILFDRGKTELKPDSLVILNKLTKLIRSFDNNIIVEGHTDDVPMHRAPFPSNWELSVIRATTVVRYFVEEKHIDPHRLSAAGYGEYRPVVPNDSEKNRARNRRVNMLIVASMEGGTEDGEGSRHR